VPEYRLKGIEAFIKLTKTTKILEKQSACTQMPKKTHGKSAKMHAKKTTKLTTLAMLL